MQVMSKFMAASKQAYELDQTMVNLEAKIRSMEKESGRQVGQRAKLEDKIKELKNLVGKLKADAVEKDTRLDHLQKKSDELCTFLGQTKEIAIRDFKASNEFTNLLDRNYTTGFEDFCLDATEYFPGVDFNPIKLRTNAESSLLQTSSEDVIIEDDASTPQPTKNGSNFGSTTPSGLSK